MKRILFLIVILFSCTFLSIEQGGLIAQNTYVNKVVVPTIGVKIMHGEMLDFGSTQIKFKEVISDSRCPKDVSCVRAGEGKALIEIYKKGILDSKKEVTFSSIKKQLEIVNTQFLKVNAMLLQPYPESTSVIKDKSDYYIVLGVWENL